MASFHCQVYYDNNPNGVYYAGQTLAGRVEVTLSKEKKLRSLYLTINGVAETSWNEQETFHDHQGKSQTRSVRYYGEENYLNSVTYLLGSQSGPEVVLKPGKHTYNFICALPALLPCSYEGTCGFVRYTTKVTLDRPWKFDQTSKAAFTVISPLDLNLDPKHRLPVERETSKSFWCGCASGPLQVRVALPQTGYAPGQDVPVCCDIQNDSRIDVQFVEIKIRKLAKYHSRIPSPKVRTDGVDLVSLKTESVPRFTKTAMMKSIRMPVVPPSLLHNCSIIDIDYEIKVKCQISGCHRSLRMDLPITVGTVPLISQNQNQNQNQNIILNAEIGFVVQPTAPPITMQPGASGPIGEDLPPSYEQCMFGTQSIHDKNDSQHTLGFQNFAPRYPVYHGNKT